MTHFRVSMEGIMDDVPEVVFMCGGFGSRMGELTQETQKCMLRYRGKPIIEYGLEEAQRYLGIFRPIFATSYREQDVRDYFGETWRGMPVTYISHRLGEESCQTIAFVRCAIKNPEFFMIHGNILFDGSILPEMLVIHRKHKPLSTIAAATKVEESSHNLIRIGVNGAITGISLPYPGSEVLNSLKDDGISFHTYASSMSYGDMRQQGYLRELGINVYSTDIFDLIDQYPRSVEHNTWLYADYWRKGGRLRGVTYEGDWLHFQSPQDLAREWVAP